MATPNIVPRADSEGGLGTSSKYWAAAYIDTITTTGNINLPDNARVMVGSSDDLQLNHNGTNSFINNLTGDLQIINYADNKDIIFKGDDGGDNIITALTLDMSDAGSAIFNNSGLFGNSNASGYTTTINGGQINGSNHLTITADASYMTLAASNNNITLDAGHDIILDAAGDDVFFKDAGTHIGTINMTSSNFTMSSIVSDKDIIFKGNDGGSTITALTLDMSEAGKATFNNDVVAFSDKKLKENIKTLDGRKVLDMRGVSFTRKDTGKESSGVIAQEIQKVAPELVSETDGTLGVSYGNLVGYLIEAVKDQQKQIDELKAIINGNSK